MTTTLTIFLVSVALSGFARAAPQHGFFGGQQQQAPPQHGGFQPGGPQHGGFQSGGSQHEGFQQGPRGQQAAPQQQHVIPANVYNGLGNDGSLNFAFQTVDGQTRAESLGSDGTVRGQYSYMGADGKPITIKYTADKNGFHASGPTLPTPPPAPVPAPQQQQHSAASPQQHFGGGGGGGGEGGHEGFSANQFPAFGGGAHGFGSGRGAPAFGGSQAVPSFPGFAGQQGGPQSPFTQHQFAPFSG